MEKLVGTLSDLGANLVQGMYLWTFLVPFLLGSLALLYIVLKIRDARREVHDTQLGLKAGLHFLLSVCLLLMLTSASVVAVNWMSKEDKRRVGGAEAGPQGGGPGGFGQRGGGGGGGRGGGGGMPNMGGSRGGGLGGGRGGASQRGGTNAAGPAANSNSPATNRAGGGGSVAANPAGRNPPATNRPSTNPPAGNAAGANPEGSAAARPGGSGRIPGNGGQGGMGMMGGGMGMMGGGGGGRGPSTPPAEEPPVEWFTPTVQTGLAVAGGSLLVLILFYALLKRWTNDSAWPAAGKVFAGWRFIIHAVVVLAAAAGLTLILTEPNFGLRKPVETDIYLALLLVWTPSLIAHLLVVLSRAKQPVTPVVVQA